MLHCVVISVRPPSEEFHALLPGHIIGVQIILCTQTSFSFSLCSPQPSPSFTAQSSTELWSDLTNSLALSPVKGSSRCRFQAIVHDLETWVAYNFAFEAMIPSHDPSRFAVVVSDVYGAKSLESFPARERYKCLASKRRFQLNIYGWSTKLSQFNWKILSSTYPCCCSLHCSKRG